jgi:putative transposase
LDDFVLMPNHIHFVVWLQSTIGETTAKIAQFNVGATLAVAQRAGASPAPTDWIIPQAQKVNLHPTLGDVVGTFKSLVFTVYLDWTDAHCLQCRAKFWQKNYYEHVVRSELELQAIRQYIRDNPRCWAEDRDNPDNRERLLPPTKVEEYLEDIQRLIVASSNLQGKN